MNTTLSENASEVAANLAYLNNEIAKAKVLVEDVIEDGKHKAERLVKRATVNTLDCIEDTTYYIKRHPWQAVGVAACVGTALGLLLSLVIPTGSTSKATD